MLVTNQDGLRWETDDETGLRVGGSLQVWIHRKADGLYYVSFVIKTWRLIIDGVTYEPDLYQNVLVNGHVIELRYKEYTFISQ